MLLFVIVGALAVASALSVILLRNPVHSAISLTFNFVCLAVLYL
jgi:NADH:ubiquinone oxidoreductase subunit 6 (subunit J)